MMPFASSANPAAALTNDLLGTHIAWGTCNGTTGIGAGTADVNIVVITKLIEPAGRISRILAIEVGLATHQHGVIEVAAGKQESVLQIERRK